MKIENAVVGMQIKPNGKIYKNWGIGVITAIGNENILATFRLKNELGEPFEMESSVEPQYFDAVDIPVQISITLDCRDNACVYGVYMKDGEVIATASAEAEDNTEFNLNDGMVLCLQSLLENINK